MEASVNPKPHCIARNCKSEKVDQPKGKFFCPVHELNVPRHLKKVLELEVAWLQHKHLPVDQHTVALLGVAANREYAQRLIRDPLAMKRHEMELAAQVEARKAAEVEKRARDAGLALPKDVGMVVPAGGGT